MPRKGTPKGKRQGGQGSQGGPSNGRPRWNPQASRLSATASPYNPSSPFASPGFRGHTLADEAKNTSKRPRWITGQDAKLRHRPVTFVSGGLIDPMKEFEVKPQPVQKVSQVKVQVEKQVEKQVEEQVEMQVDEQVEEQPDKQVEEQIVPAVSAQSDADADAADLEPDPADHLRSLLGELSAPRSPDLFVLDTTGDKSLRPKKLETLPIVPRDESDHDSDSSEEVILFRGRDPALRSAAVSQRALPKPKDTTDSIQLREIDVEIKLVEKTMDRATKSNPISIQEFPPQVPEKPSAKTTATPQADAPEEDEPSYLDTLLDATQSDEEAALIADYMAHMDDDEEDDEEDEEGDAHPGLGSHAFHLLRDLGGSDSDAIPEPITGDESNEDDSGDEAAAENKESSDAQRRRMVLEDERIAKLLAKQEELGLGGDDLMLYDDADEDDQGGEWLIAPKATPRRKKKGSTKQAKIIQKKGQYPSATEMANAFDDLDLMDWHRAALNNFEQASKRASKAPEHSDSELEEAMQMAWKKDRLKKAEKKKQREALRARGLLGKNINPDDLRVKYPVGMSKEELVEELEQFVIGDDEQLIFPPLDKHARKCLHTVASHLKIKSQSSGSGDNRHPVLFRTGRTLAYEERTFDSIVNRVFRRSYFTRVDVDTEVAKVHRAGIRKDPSGLKRKDNALSYKEGEVVGQHAKELTSDNKGRMLLEKMGWSKGMALGTVDNKGIMVPISQVMKKSRLGLGDI